MNYRVYRVNIAQADESHEYREQRLVKTCAEHAGSAALRVTVTVTHRGIVLCLEHGPRSLLVIQFLEYFLLLYR